MRKLLLTLFLLAAIPAFAADAAGHGVVKVLPLLVDLKGRIAESPSLFDRDAYQAYLREHTNEVSGVRFDLLLQPGKTLTNGMVRIEIRGIGEGGLPQQATLEQKTKASKYRHWETVNLAGNDYKKIGSMVAWRATLWNENEMLGEEKSFLW